MMLSLPIRDSIYAVLIIGTLVWGPLFFIAFHSGNTMIGKTILNDTLFLGISAFVFGTSIYKFRYMIAALEIKHEIQASKFLGPAVTRAIFEDSEGIFQEKRLRGFIVNLDIRDSTELQKTHGTNWLTFRKDYFALVSKVVSKHKGYIQKTAGDGHIINFGVMDDVVDLSGIPNIETEEARAEHARLERASNSAMACLDELFIEFFRVVAKHFGDESVRLGGGIDKGWVERGVQGDRQTSMELDVNGDSVNCSARLQEYSKAVRGQFDAESSLLVLSPFASDYIPADKLILYKRIETTRNPIRNYANIRWVLVREFKKSAVGVKKKSA
jgi:class 3 adenylate cyclase